ncbi:MAG: M48 family metalloprotease [Planctomycetales bacterium]|nr:M48 family metalloprotease [Planctomycetales bacterium]
MTHFIENPITQAVGIALLHSLWQILFVAAVFVVIATRARRWTANSRYIASYGSLVLMLLLPLVTFTLVFALQTGVPRSIPEASQFGPGTHSTQPLFAAQVEHGFVENAMQGFLLEPTDLREERSKTSNEVAGASSKVASVFAVSTWNQIQPWLAILWSVGVITFSMRPLLSVHRCVQMRQSAELIEKQWITSLMPALCERIGLGKVIQVASSKIVETPSVIGVVSPIVLLPASLLTGFSPDLLKAILAHELAHIRRHDFAMNLVQTAIETLLFYHPAVWWITSIVRQERENCCDDIALAICGRKSYAKALVDLELVRSGNAGLAMAANGGSLYRRIHRIVHPGESSTPSGAGLATCVAVLPILLAWLTFHNGPAIAADQTEQSTTVQRSDTENSALTARETEVANVGDNERSFKGTVFDANGKPVGDATVYVVAVSFDVKVNGTVSRSLSAQSQSDGTYSITVTPRNNEVLMMVAQKAGCGAVTVDLALARTKAEQKEITIDLNLLEEMPIKGRVVDTEGNPVSGVEIRVEILSVPKSEEAVTEWIANEKPELFTEANNMATRFGRDERIRGTQFPAVATIPLGESLPDAETTSSNGEFRLVGVGKDCLLRVSLSGPGIASREALIVAREMKSVTAYAAGIFSRDFTHHGANPTLVVSPAQAVTGRILDAQTKQPITGLPVMLRRTGRENWLAANAAERTLTDSEGRFELSSAPLGGGHMISIIAGPDSPYFDTDFEFPVTSSPELAPAEIELTPAVWIRGRVTDESGSPVVAIVDYYPFRENKYAEAYSNFDPRIAGRAPNEKQLTNRDGFFRIKAIPGRGVLSALAQDQQDRLKYMPNREPRLLDEIGGEQMRKLFNGWSADYFDALIEINIDEGLAETSQDVVFKSGGTKKLTLWGESGTRPTKIQQLGLTFPPKFTTIEANESTVEVIGLQPDEPRLVVLIDEKNECGIALTVKDSDPGKQALRLQECAKVNGRVVDSNGEPVDKVNIRVSPVLEMQRDSWNRELRSVSTNANGKFSLSIPSGCAFRVFAYSEMGPNFTATIRPKPGAIYHLGDLKDKDDLNEVETAGELP